MSQITLYLDDVSEALLQQAAQANGLSKSKWVSKLIRQHGSDEWPRECLEFAGRFADFPLIEDRESYPAAADAVRLAY